MYGGTPRGLLFIDDPFESNRFIKELSGAHVIVSFGKRNKLTAIKKLFPENVLIGRNDRLGGILDEHNGLSNFNLAIILKIILFFNQIFFSRSVRKTKIRITIFDYHR